MATGFSRAFLLPLGCQIQTQNPCHLKHKPSTMPTTVQIHTSPCLNTCAWEFLSLLFLRTASKNRKNGPTLPWRFVSLTFFSKPDHAIITIRTQTPGLRTSEGALDSVSFSLNGLCVVAYRWQAWSLVPRLMFLGDIPLEPPACSPPSMWDASCHFFSLQISISLSPARNFPNTSLSLFLNLPIVRSGYFASDFPGLLLQFFKSSWMKVHVFLSSFTWQTSPGKAS